MYWVGLKEIIFSIKGLITLGEVKQVLVIEN